MCEYLKIQNMELKQYNTMRLDSCGKIVYLPYSPKGVEQLFKDNTIEKYYILGQGSNTIFSKRYNDTPIILTSFLNDIKSDSYLITSGSGVTLSRLSWYALENSIEGFEFLEDIPGSIGGALYMNAGTYDDSIGNLVYSVKIYDFDNKKYRLLDKEDLLPFWGKRNSYFQHHKCFITECTFEIQNMGSYEEILNRMLTIKKNRYLKQPRNYPNAGSTFRRPYINEQPMYIWKLFDEAGLRGYRIGGAQISEKHPGFIINRGNATAKDILELMNHCKSVIMDKYGIRIEEEWNII